MFYLVCIFLLINLCNLLPSDVIWNKTLQYMDEGKMRYPDDKNYFIFDESNYTALDINGTKMEALFIKQKYLYEKYKIPNYIFAVDNQDDNIETNSNATHNLAALLKSEFNIDSDNTLIGFFSIANRKTRIRTGNSLKRIITDYKADLIAKDLENNLRAKNYYGAWNRLLDNVISYKSVSEAFNYNYSSPSNYSRPSNSSDSNRPTTPGGGSKSKSKSWAIIVSIAVLVVVLGVIGLCFYCCIRKRRNSRIERDDHFRKVCKFLQDNRNNQAIFTEYCALCLEKLNNEPNQEIKTEAGIIVNPEGIKSNTINTFSCGHQFHTNCITQFKIAVCPICEQRGNPDYNQEDAKIIWGTQGCLFPILKGYNYNDIYKFDLNKRISTSSKIHDVDPYEYQNHSISYSAPSNNISYGGASNNAPSVGSGGADGGW